MNCINITSRLVGLFVIETFLLLITAGCGKSQKQPQQQPQQQKIVVKGFYIGMTAAEVSNSIKNIPGLYEPGPIDEAGGFVIDTGTPISPGSRSSMDFHIDSKTDGHLSAFEWFPDAVAFLFNSRSLNTEEFVQQFANSYNIPKFTSRQRTDGKQEWVYRTPDNIEIEIVNYEGTWLIIRRNNSPETIRNSFN